MSEISELVDALNNLRKGLENTIPKNSNEEEKKSPQGFFAKLAAPMEKLGSFVTKASLTLSGFVAAGLRSTVEGYKMSLAFERLSYQIADVMHGPIVALTGFINQLAAEFNFLNKVPIVRNFMAMAGSVLIGATAIKGMAFIFAPLISAVQALAAAMGIATLAMLGYAALILGVLAVAGATGATVYTAAGQFKDRFFTDHNPHRPGADNAPESTVEITRPGSDQPKDMIEYGGDWKEKSRYDAKTDKWSTDHKGETAKIAKDEEHNKPMYQTSFTQLTSLWEQMNKAVTENPGLDVVASWLEKIFNKLPDVDKGGPPNPQPAGAIGP